MHAKHRHHHELAQAWQASLDLTRSRGDAEVRPRHPRVSSTAEAHAESAETQRDWGETIPPRLRGSA